MITFSKIPIGFHECSTVGLTINSATVAVGVRSQLMGLHADRNRSIGMPC